MFSKLAFNLAGYNKYGLYSDDVIYHDSPVVKEALRRLPKEVLDARNFRYFRRCVIQLHSIFLSPDRVIRIFARLYARILDSGSISRSIRAAQLDFLKMNLPREKWITYEQDMSYRYLQPYIMEIIMEKQEVNEFGCTNYAEWHWPSEEIK